MQCLNCDRKLADIKPINARRIAIECLCTSRVSLHVLPGGEISTQTRPSGKPPAYFYDLPDTQCLRESIVAVNDLKRQAGLIHDKIRALQDLRAPVMERERARLMAEALGGQLVQNMGSPLAAIKAVLEQLDPDTAKEMMAAILAELSV